jgi:hypothetical protein
MRQLDNPSYRNLQAFFRRERFGVWVQFLEMELHRHQWLEHNHSPDRQRASATGH